MSTELAPVIEINMQHPGGGRRDGSPGKDGRRQGWGPGQNTGRINTWKHKEGDGQGNPSDAGKEKAADAKHDKNQDDSKWEGSKSKDDAQDQWGSAGAIKDSGGAQPRQTPNGNPTAVSAHKGPCERCGLHNHATKDCRRLFCEICGLNHHTFDCKKCVP